jgi:predicted metal-dependent phosphoesterase TrpH
MSVRCLFHVHTRYSPDSLLQPSKIVMEARRHGAEVLIVTDHNTIKGSQEAQKLVAGGNMMVPTAAEYQTEKGDIIGVFLKEEIRLGSAEEVIQQIRDQAGLIVLPHPFKAHRLDSQLLTQMDLIEIHNSRCSPKENASAADLAAQLGRPGIGGADAHCASELGAVMNHFSGEAPRDEEGLRQILLGAPRQIASQKVSGVYRPYSQMIKAVKTRNPHLFLSQSRRLALTWVRESWRRSA